MPRIARKNYETCYFHVIVQGYEREYIFENDYLKSKYLELMLNEKENRKIELLEYCIMGNHAHLLMYCESIEEMSLYMKKLNIKYALFYNKLKNRVGYVFRDRFLSEAIMNEKHLLSCIPYIHFNPVVAKIVESPDEYKYSSYNDFIMKKGIVTDSVLIKLFNCKDNYLDLFNILHLNIGEGMEYKNDERTLSIIQSKDMILNILNKYCIKNIKDETIEVQKYFLKKFIRERISLYHIEKILQIDHRKAKKLIDS